MSDFQLKTYDSFGDEGHARFEGYASDILNLLKIRPHLSSELKEITHRFSVGIQKLRDRGYIIDGEALPRNDWLWTLIGYEENRIIKPRHRESYYLSKHWRRFRSERLYYDKYRCVQCHRRSEDLHVHHWKYDLFAEELHDCSTMCVDCHNWIHSVLTIRFPIRAKASIVERLQMIVDFLDNK